MPSKRRQSTRSRLKQTVSYQISGQCFRGGDESTDASQEDNDDENVSTSSNSALTRLRFVVTSVFGLREAARYKAVAFDHYTSRLLMISIGPNVSGDGLNGCSRETLDFLCSYQPDVVSLRFLRLHRCSIISSSTSHYTFLAALYPLFS